MSSVTINRRRQIYQSASPRPEATTAWHIHTGYCRISIIGPGERAFLSLGKPNYTEPPGTPAERALAAAACALLNRESPSADEAGPDTIREALRRAAGGEEPAESAHPTYSAAPSYRPALATPAAPPPPELRPILAEVQAETHISPTAILGRACSPDIYAARTLAVALFRQRHPDWHVIRAAAAFSRSYGFISKSHISHVMRMEESPAYRATAALLGISHTPPA